MAVAFSNHLIYLTNAHTGKIIHQIDCSMHANMPISMLGWGLNFAHVNASRKQPSRLQFESAWDDLISQGTQLDELDILPDLPRDLAFLDLEGSLPKLSSLSVATGGKE